MPKTVADAESLDSGSTIVTATSDNVMSIGNINTLFSLFHQGKKDINDAVQPWNTRNLSDSSRHTQYHSFQGINPAKFRPPGMPATCRYFCSQQFGELTGLN